MADQNLNVVISADVARLTAGMLQAQAAVKLVGAEARVQSVELAKLAAAGKQDTEEFRQLKIELTETAAALESSRGLANKLVTEQKKLVGSLGETTEAAHSAGHGIGGITRELLVLGHEASQGNFKRLGGSLMVMGELLSNTIPVGMLATVGAIGAAGFAAFEMTEKFVEAQRTIDGMQGTLALLGRSDVLPRKELDAWIKSMSQAFNISESDARAVAEQLVKLTGAAATYQKELGGVAIAEALAAKQPVAEKAKEVTQGFRDAATAAKTLEEKTGKLDPVVSHHIETLIKAGHETEAFAAIMDQLLPRLSDTTAWAKQTAAVQEYGSALGNLGPAAEAFALSNPSPKQPDRTPSSTRSASAGEMAAYLRSRHSYTAEQAAALLGQGQIESGLRVNPTENPTHSGMFQWDESRFAKLKDFAASIGADWKDWRTQLDFANREIEQMAPEFFKAKTIADQTRILTGKFEIPAKPGTSSFDAEVSKRQAAAESIAPQARTGAETTKELEDQHKARQAAYQRELILHRGYTDQELAITRQQVADTIAYEGNSASAQAEGAVKIAAAERAAREQALQNTLHSIDLEAIAQRQSDTAQLDAAKKKFAAVATEHGKGTSEYNSAETAVAQAEAMLRDHAYQVFTEKERAKVEGARGNSTRILSIYDEWLNAVQNVYHRDQREFERVQREKTAAAQRGAAEARQIAEADLSQQARRNDIILQTRKLQLDQDVDHHSKNAQEALAIERDLTQQLDAENLRRLEAYRNTLKDLPREQAKIDLQIMEQKLRDAEKLAQIDKKAADESAKIWKEVNNEIASAASSSIMGMMTGRQSMVQGLEQIGERYLNKALDWGIREALQWAETEAMKTSISGAANAVRGAMDNDSALGFIGSLGKQLLAWAGLETAKTGETAAGTGLRTGIDLAGSAVAAKAMIPIAFSEIQMSAAAAAAATFADMAMLGPPGSRRRPRPPLRPTAR